MIDEAFCSSHADEALDLLGDLHFEKGNFEEARRCWRMITFPLAEKYVASVLAPLRFPNPKVDLPRVRAKQLLAQLSRETSPGRPPDWIPSAVGIPRAATWPVGAGCTPTSCKKSWSCAERRDRRAASRTGPRSQGTARGT